MTTNRNVGGVFYPILRFLGIRVDFTQKSRRWKAVLATLTALALVIVAGLFLFANRSHSQIGGPVVVVTLLGGLVLLLLQPLERNLVTAGRVSKHRGRFVFIAALLLLCTGLSIVAWFMKPLEVMQLTVSVVLGSATLGGILILLYEGYPKLGRMGMPGYLTMSGLTIVLAVVYMTAVSRYIVPYDPFTLNVGPLRAPPSLSFPLGTTALGQDLLSRTIAGGATMLQVAVLSVIVCYSVGVPLGLAASYRGGIPDRAVSLVMDSIFALPGLVLAIAVSAILGRGVVNMALAIAVVYIPSYFRVVRSQVLTVKELPYVEAAVVLGARNRDVLLKYILPNVLPSSFVVMSMNFADAILTAAGLTFIGLGMDISVADWGWDLTSGSHELLVVGAWWIITFPGLMIVILALGFALIGEGINEILTPRLKE